MHFNTEFIEQAIYRMEENTTKLNKCLEEIDENELWTRPNASSNSIGNLILHLCGNITQYIISSLGNKEDLRERDAEFNAKGGLPKEHLHGLLTQTIQEAIETMRDLPPEVMLHKRQVQGFEFSAIGIIIHVVEHYSYHTGQIAFWIKLLKDKDLAFYADFDLNAKNKD